MWFHNWKNTALIYAIITLLCNIKSHHTIYTEVWYRLNPFDDLSGFEGACRFSGDVEGYFNFCIKFLSMLCWVGWISARDLWSPTTLSNDWSHHWTKDVPSPFKCHWNSVTNAGLLTFWGDCGYDLDYLRPLQECSHEIDRNTIQVECRMPFPKSHQDDP